MYFKILPSITGNIDIEGVKKSEINDIQSQLLRYVKLFILEFFAITYKDSNIVGLRDHLFSV